MSVPVAIDAQSADVAAILAEIAQVVVAEGGSVHPGVRLVERAGDMRIECDDVTAEAAPLVVVPRHLLVPVAGIRWSADPTRLEPVEGVDALDPRQRDLLGLWVALMNATGKPAWYRAWHPKAALADGPATAAIGRLRPTFAPAPGADGWLRTRTFRLKDAAGAPGRPPTSAPVLLPLLDLVNHHPDSPGFAVRSGSMSVAVSQPTGTRECFVGYGAHRDTLDLALSHGFVEPHVRYAFSAPLALTVEGLGTVEVGSARPPATGERTYPQVGRTPTGLRFSELCFEADYPDRIRTVIGLPVRGIAAQSGLSPAAADAVVERTCEAIVAANLGLLDDLARALVDDPTPAARMLSAAAGLQAERIAASG